MAAVNPLEKVKQIAKCSAQRSNTMPHQRPATEEARQSIVKQSEDAARLAELFAAASPLSDQQMVEITCPTSARPGEHIEAQTASGRMHVTIPDGVRPGQVFLVRRAPAVGRAHAEVEPYHPITDSIESRYRLEASTTSIATTALSHPLAQPPIHSLTDALVHLRHHQPYC